MKYLFTLLLAIMLSVDLFSQVKPAQQPPAAKDTVYEVVDIPAEFLGGQEAWSKYLIRNLNFNVDTTENCHVGYIRASFIVHLDGTLTDWKIKDPKPDCAKLEAEVLKIIKASPNWRPAIKNGKKVTYKHSLAFHICLVEE
jgi:protein TonB